MDTPTKVPIPLFARYVDEIVHISMMVSGAYCQKIEGGEAGRPYLNLSDPEIIPAIVNGWLDLRRKEDGTTDSDLEWLLHDYLPEELEFVKEWLEAPIAEIKAHS